MGMMKRIKYSNTYTPNSTVFGIVYHTAPIGMGGRYYARQVDWCTANFGECSSSRWMDDGPITWKPRERWYANGDYFWFREEKDKMWYMLRWSS